MWTVQMGGAEVWGWIVEWLAGLFWERLGCVGFVYKIVEITAASSDNGGGRALGLLCVEVNGACSNLAIVVHFEFFFPCRFFSKF